MEPECTETESQRLLTTAFGDEFMDLPPFMRTLLGQDYIGAFAEGCGVLEYRRRIGVGNLESYGRCLVVGVEKNRR